MCVVCVCVCVRVCVCALVCGCAYKILPSMHIKPRSSLFVSVQYILRMMAFGQLKDLLGVEVPDSLQSFLASRKRSSVDYSSDISEEKKAKME